MTKNIRSRKIGSRACGVRNPSLDLVFRGAKRSYGARRHCSPRTNEVIIRHGLGGTEYTSRTFVRLSLLLRSSKTRITFSFKQTVDLWYQ